MSERSKKENPPTVASRIELAIQSATAELSDLLSRADQRRDILKIDDGQLGWPGFVPSTSRLAAILASIRDADIADCDRRRLELLARTMRESLWDACEKRRQAMPHIVVGSRVHDMQDGGGIVVAADAHSVAYVSDTNDEGDVRLAWQSMDEIVLMDAPPIVGDAMQAMLDRYCPRPAASLDGPAHPESFTLADDFANGKSVDGRGRRLHLYDRVYVSEGFEAIIVAIAADKLLAVVDDDHAPFPKGSTIYEDAASVRRMRPTEHPKFYVAGLIDD